MMTVQQAQRTNKPIVWLHGEVKTPPFGVSARLETGVLLRRLQLGDLLGLPHSRPMPSMGVGCHELRISDQTQAWRIVYCIADTAIVILEVFAKTTQQTPKPVIEVCKLRLARYHFALLEKSDKKFH